MVVNVCPVVLEILCPLWLIFGQYLHWLGRLHVWVDMYVSLLVVVLVGAFVV